MFIDTVGRLHASSLAETGGGAHMPCVGAIACTPARAWVDRYRDTPAKTAGCGALAGGVSVLLFQGLDVVKSRMQGLDADKYRSALNCAREMLQTEGVRSFYKGVGPRLARVCSEVAITMTLYGEVVKRLDRHWVVQ